MPANDTDTNCMENGVIKWNKNNILQLLTVLIGNECELCFTIMFKNMTASSQFSLTELLKLMDFCHSECKQWKSYLEHCFCMHILYLFSSYIALKAG